jgi:hypothetical protein
MNWREDNIDEPGIYLFRYQGHIEPYAMMRVINASGKMVAHQYDDHKNKSEIDSFYPFEWLKVEV